MENVTSTNSNGMDALVGTFAGGQEAGTTALWGFLGPSPGESFRLYTDVSFGRFYEIPQSAVVRMDDDEEDTGGTTVHVAPSAEIRLNETSTTTPVSAFLEGTIAATYLPQPSHSPWQAAAYGHGPATMGCLPPTANCAAGGGGGGAGGGGPLCITVYTAVPTWCNDPGRNPGGGGDPRCTQVAQTLVCTLDPPQVAGEGKDACVIVLGTQYCTQHDIRQNDDAGCAGIGDTPICTFDAKQQGPAGVNCAHVLKSLVCTIPLNVTTCLPFTTCFMVLGTTTCTTVPKTGPICLTYDTARPTNCDKPCAKVLNTIVCTLDIRDEQAAAARDAGGGGGVPCEQLLGTVVCTHGDAGAARAQAAGGGGGAPDIPCFIIMTTVKCTWDIPQQQQQVCLMYVTAIPTMCEPPGPPCRPLLTTLVCTLPPPAGAAEDAQCRVRQYTAICTYEGQPGAEALFTRMCGGRQAAAPQYTGVTETCTVSNDYCTIGCTVTFGCVDAAAAGRCAANATPATTCTEPFCRVQFTPATVCTQTARQPQNFRTWDPPIAPPTVGWTCQWCTVNTCACTAAQGARGGGGGQAFTETLTCGCITTTLLNTCPCLAAQGAGGAGGGQAFTETLTCGCITTTLLNTCPCLAAQGAGGAGGGQAAAVFTNVFYGCTHGCAAGGVGGQQGAGGGGGGGPYGPYTGPSLGIACTIFCPTRTCSGS